MFFKKSKVDNKNITIVPTMKDKITDNSVWCATFKLVWDDLQYGILENNFICNQTNETIENLIKDNIVEDVLSKEDYYKVVGKPTLKLKEEIEKELLERFNEKSSILDSVKFSDSETDNILLYTMLKKIFLFEYEFDELRKGKFGKYKKDVEYFGIDYNTSRRNKISNQVEVLFYNSSSDYSVKLYTKEKDSIILYRTKNLNDNFEDVFNEINNKSRNNMDRYFSNMDTLKIPNLSLNIMKNYQEIIGKTFIRNRDNMPFSIAQAMQTIEFKLDRTGGMVKSEALMQAKIGAIYDPNFSKPRHFNFDDTFYLFLIEKRKERPYLALRVQDIEKFIN